MPFHCHAHDFNAVNLVPLPVIDKRPAVFNFNRWKGLAPRTIDSFADRFPEADLAILTRLSGLAVVDVDTDDPSFAAEVFSEFGFTPVTVKTRKGWHFYYSNPNKIPGIIHPTKPIDIKGAGRSDYIVVPPTEGYEFHLRSLDSIPEDTDDIFAFLKILQRRNRLPILNQESVDHFFSEEVPEIRGQLVANDNEPIEIESRFASFEEFDELHFKISLGARNHILFKWGMFRSSILVKQYDESSTTLHLLHADLLDKNEKSCDPPLPEREVERIADSIWYNFQIKGRNYFCNRHELHMTNISMTPKGILENLNHSNRFSLLIWLKSLYNDGDEFILNTPAMADFMQPSKVTIDKMKKYLIENEFIEQVSEHDRNKKIAAKFILTAKSNEYVIRIPSISHSNDNDSLDSIHSHIITSPPLTG